MLSKIQNTDKKIIDLIKHKFFTDESTDVNSI